MMLLLHDYKSGEPLYVEASEIVAIAALPECRQSDGNKEPARTQVVLRTGDKYRPILYIVRETADHIYRTCNLSASEVALHKE